MVKASISENKTATEIVIPNCMKNFPIIPVMKATGIKIATTAAVAAIAAKVISRAPMIADSILFFWF